MTCKDCNGTGKIVLFTSMVDCSCQEDQIFPVKILLKNTHNAWVEFGLRTEDQFRNILKEAIKGMDSRVFRGTDDFWAVDIYAKNSFITVVVDMPNIPYKYKTRFCEIFREVRFGG